MDRNEILKEAQAELQRHTWGTFVDKGLSVALGGNGIVIPDPLKDLNVLLFLQ
jgi:hypothetical protein